MTHLTDERVADLLDGAPGAAESAHLAACGTCAEKLRGARAALRELIDVDVPEPSPLFWAHFASRVRDAADAPSVPRTRWLSAGVLGWTAAAAVLLIGLAAMYAPRMADADRAVGADRPASVTAVESLGGSDDIDADEAWAVVRSLAVDVDYDAAREAGVAPRADAVDVAATELSAAERAELMRLLDEELKRTGA